MFVNVVHSVFESVFQLKMYQNDIFFSNLILFLTSIHQNHQKTPKHIDLIIFLMKISLKNRLNCITKHAN